MKTILSSRVKKIIKYIINNPQLVTIRDISEHIQVSRRTVLREMDDVYAWFISQNRPLNKVANKGLQLDITEPEKIRLLDVLQTELEDYYYTKEERVTFILTELLQNKEPSKLFYFADMLNVSEATISHDLDRVEEWLDTYKLTLTRKPGVGVHIDGKERNIRKALITIIYDSLDGEQVRSILSKYVNILPSKAKQSTDIKKRLLDLIDYKIILQIESAIEQSEKDMGFQFVESSYTALAVHLALAIKRIMNGDRISIEQDVLEGLKVYEEFHIASNLVRSLSDVLHLDIPDDEIAYVTMHLKGAKYKSGLVDSSVLQFNEIIISNYKLTSIIHKMIKIAEQETGYKLSKNDSLLIGLVEHLRPAINRLQMNLDIRNPLLDVIQDKYPEIYAISQKCASVIEESLGVVMPESEIGYIAMHIGSAIERIKNVNALDDVKYNIVVTCTSGIGTSRMLAERIKAEFNNISIVEVFSSTKVTDEWLYDNEIDLIVSTVHFHNDTVPVTVVNPLLLENDIEKLTKKLESITLVRPSTVAKEEHKKSINEQLHKLHTYSSAIIEILDNFLFVENVTSKTFKDFLHVVATNVHTDKKKAKQLSKEIVKREKIGSIVFPEEKVIMLHTRTNTTDQIYIGVFRNQEEIKYSNHSFVAAIVLIAPHDIDSPKLEVIGEISSKLINDPSFLLKIKKSKHNILIETIEETLYDFYQQHNQT